MDFELTNLCSLDLELYKCVSSKIATSRVVLTEKSVIHIAEHHPDAYLRVLVELKETIQNPDYIFNDDKHEDTALVVKRVSDPPDSLESTFVVLRICTDTANGQLANSVISGWTISKSRLQNYLRNKAILYKKV